ncbi:MAG TPA: tetratricopeptide repeat protein [Micropepsaceae bacterium]
MSVNADFDGLKRIREAIALHQQGRLAEAERLYRDILAHTPDQPDALHFLGILEGQRGRHQPALQLLDRALAVNPRHPAIAYNRANLLRDMGRLEDALTGYDTALAIKPDNVLALGNRGAVLHGLGRYDDAMASYERALALKPGDCDTHSNRANALAALGRHEDALAGYDKALAGKPGHVAALYGRGNALAKLGRPEEALASYDRAVQCDPGNAELLANRAIVLSDLNRYEEALAEFASSIARAPENAESFNSRGLVFMQLRRHRDALADFTRACELNPAFANALYGRASALVELNRHDEAIPAFEQLLRQAPDYPYGLGMLVYAQRTACDWRDLSASAALADAIAAGKRVATPLVLLAISDSPSLKLRCAEVLIADKFRPVEEPLWRGDRSRHERIRVAYLSADFRPHPVAILMAGVFEHHDRERFETIAISYGTDDKSMMRARLMQSFERFIDVRGKSDRQVAALIHDMEADILVDLTGLTASARPGILAFRPAPVQVNYLGFAGSLGAPYTDYILADTIVIPEDQQVFYAEKMAYLPASYLPHDSKRRIAERAPARGELGLPDSGFVFASFNNSYKFTPEIFDVWMRLLRKIEGSVLWLSASNAAAQRNLKREAEARGVAGHRIVFAGFVPQGEDHLARLAAADLFLDTFPYNAHTTASDALWAGLPLLTCKGQSFASAVAASLLQACGLPELITDSLAAYENRALDLARNAAALADIRAKLSSNRDVCALFDTARFTRNLERAYTTMWKRSQSGTEPTSFHVEPVADP